MTDAEQEDLNEQLWEACHLNDWHDAIQILYKGANNDHVNTYDGSTAYIIAAINGQRGIVTAISIKSPNAEHNTFRSISEFHTKNKTLVVQELTLKCEKEPWFQNWTSQQFTNTDSQRAKDGWLWFACQEKICDMASVWLDKGATNQYVNREGQSALHRAAYHGETNVVLDILERYPVELERKDTNMVTALGSAFSGRKYDTASCLLENHASHAIVQLLLCYRKDSIEKSFDKGLKKSSSLILSLIFEKEYCEVCSSLL